MRYIIGTPDGEEWAGGTDARVLRSGALRVTKGGLFPKHVITLAPGAWTYYYTKEEEAL